MSITMNPTTFETTFSRPDVRNHLRTKCASNYYKKMTEIEKNELYARAPKTVNADGEQISPKPKDELKTADWIREIIGSWNRVEANYIPVSEMEVIVMKPEQIDILNQKFEQKEIQNAEKKAAKEAEKAEKKAAKEVAKEEKKAAKEAAKNGKKLEKLKQQLDAIDPNAELNSDGLVVVKSVTFANDNGDMTITMTIKEYAKDFKSKQKQAAKDAAKEEKFQAKLSAAAEKLQAKEAAKAEKKAAKEAEKAEKKAAKEAEKAEKKRVKLVIKETVKHLTDSDKRVLITDNTEWLTSNGFMANSIEEYITNITAKDYKNLLNENRNELSKMSWSQQNNQ